MLSICKLPLLVLAACFLLSCSGQHHPEASVELKVTTEAVYWKGVRLDFNQPAKAWVDAINEHYVFPGLGIDLKVISDIPYGEGKAISKPLDRPVEVIRVYLNSNADANSLFQYENESIRSHVYNSMRFPYAINFYGALVDRHTSKQQVLDLARGVSRNNHFNILRVRSEEGDKVNLSVFFNDFNGNRKEISHMLQIYPSGSWKYRNNIEYFRYPEQQPRKAQ